MYFLPNMPMGTSPRSDASGRPGARSSLKKTSGVPRRRTLPLFGGRSSSTSSTSFLFGKGAAGEEAAAAGQSGKSMYQRTKAAAVASGKEAAADFGGEDRKSGRTSFVRSRGRGRGGEGRGGEGEEQKKKGSTYHGKKSGSHHRTASRSEDVRHGKREVISVAADYKSSRLFIRNLPPFVSVAELKDKFSSLGGEITDVCLLVTEAGRSRQCAFMGFKTQAQAAAAKDYFNSTFFYTRRITVDFALPRHAASTSGSSTASAAAASRQQHTNAPAPAAGTAAAATDPATDAGTLTDDTRASDTEGRRSRSSSERQAEQQAGCSSSSSSRHVVGKGVAAREEKTKRAAPVASVVQEEVVQARKAGVSRVRKRLIFEDFFSSSDEEGDAKKDDKEAQQEESSSSSSVGNGVAAQQEKKKRKRNAAVAQVADDATAAEGAASAAAAAGSSGRRGVDRSADSAAGSTRDAASARNSSSNEDSAAKNSSSEGDSESSGGDTAAAEVDDLTWLRQASAAHAAEALTEITGSSAAKAVSATEGVGEGESREGKKGRRERGAGVSVAAARGGAEKEGEKKQEQQEEEALSSLGVCGRLLLCNFPFATTQEELEALCGQYGEVAETHLVHDEETRKSKGYAFVTYVFPEHAVAALAKLDGMIFQGRLLHAEAAKPDTQREIRRQQRQEQQQKKGSSSSYKRRKQQELLQQHNDNQAFMEEKVWNLLYVSANAAVDAVAREFQVDKDELLGDDRADSTAAARVALAETHLLQATREWIIKEGISAKAFERRGPTLLAASSSPAASSSSAVAIKRTKGGDGGSADAGNKKNSSSLMQEEGDAEKESQAMGRSRDTLIVKHLPTAHVVGAELLLMFEKVGKVERFLLAPSKTIAIVQYEKERDATAAYRRLAYRKYKNVPLFIEKAPVDIFVGEEEERKQAHVEAAEEAKAARQADMLAAASSNTPPQENGAARRKERCERRGSTAEEKNAAALNSFSREGMERLGTGRRNRDEVNTTTEDIDGNDGCGGVCTLQSAAVCAVTSGFTTTSRKSSEATEAKGKDKQIEEEEEENVDSVTGYSLFVKNLNFSTTEAALGEVFSPCVGLRKVKLMTKKRPIAANKAGGTSSEPAGFETLSLGYAFVEFDSAANATAACKRMQDIVVDGHTLKISISRSAPQQRKRQSASSLAGGSGSTAAAGRKGGAAAAGAAAAKSRKLLVRNLAFQATTADLRSLFSAYGNVTRVCIPTQHEGRSRGFGFVDMSTRFEAAAALQALSGTHLYGRKLVLEVAAQETEGTAARG